MADHEPREVGRSVGRLTATPDCDVPSDLDDEADAVAWSEEADDLSAEESAMHLAKDPKMGEPHDGYYD